MACILDVCWPRSCNIVFSLISILVCLLEIIVCALYHTAWIPLIIAAVGVIAAVVFLVISIEDVPPHKLLDKKDFL